MHCITSHSTPKDQELVKLNDQNALWREKEAQSSATARALARTSHDNHLSSCRREQTGGIAGLTKHDELGACKIPIYCSYCCKSVPTARARADAVA